MSFRELPRVFKISSLICGACLSVWIVFVGIMFMLQPSQSTPSPKDWMGIVAFTAGVAVVPFCLSLLGGYIIKGNKGAVRLGTLISVLWVLAILIAFTPYETYRGESWPEFFGVGFLPVIFFWGILWVISGFLSRNIKIENL